MQSDCQLESIMAMKTRGELEAAICDGISRFEQDYFGRGPQHIHAHLIGDLLVIRLQGGADMCGQHLPSQDTAAGKGAGSVETSSDSAD